MAFNFTVYSCVVFATETPYRIVTRLKANKNDPNGLSSSARPRAVICAPPTTKVSLISREDILTPVPKHGEEPSSHTIVINHDLFASLKTVFGHAPERFSEIDTVAGYCIEYPYFVLLYVF